MIRRFGKAELTVALMLAMPLFVACGSDESPPPAPAPAAKARPWWAHRLVLEGAASTAAACADQQVQECRVELGQQGTVQNCFVGLQLCSKGVWGPCQSAADIEAQLNSQ